MFRVYEFDKANDRYTFVTNADAEVNMQNFASKAVPKLNSGSLSDKLTQALKNAGLDVGAPRLELKAESAVWEFTADVKGTPKTFEIRLEPQFWERHRKGIRFIKSLDHIWIYR